MGEANEHLVASSPEGMFVMLFLGVLDMTGGGLRYANLGHPPALLVCGSTGEVTRLDAGAPIVGAVPGARFLEGRVALALESALTVYSDGVTEAMNGTGQMFEECRLIAALGTEPRPGAENILGRVLAGVDEFVGNVEQGDDITVVSVCRRREARAG